MTPEEIAAKKAADEAAAETEAAAAVPPTEDELRATAAGMTVEALKERHVEIVEKISELRAVEAKTLATVTELKQLGLEAKIVKETHDEIVSLEDISPEDLAKPDAEENDGDAGKVNDAVDAKKDSPDDGVIDTVEVDADGKELVTAGANGGNAGAPSGKVNTDSAVELKPFVMAAVNGPAMTTLDDIGKALMSVSSLDNSQSWIGSFKPYGSDVTAGVLTNNPVDNFRTLYGSDTKQLHKAMNRQVGREAVSDRNSITAALNCADPAKVVEDIPFCYTAGRPLMDSGVIAMMEAINGQIQLYSCHALPDFGTIINAAADCDDCNTTPSLTCATHTCIEPMQPMEPSPEITCLCLPESLRFSAPFVLERALEDFAIATDIAYEAKWLAQLRNLSLVRDVTSAAPHGAHATIVRAILQLKSRLALDARCTNGIADYTAFIPGGESMFITAMADKMSRVGEYSDNPGQDLIAFMESQGVQVVFGLDPDPSGSAIAEGFTDVFTSEDLGNAGRQELEDFVDAGSIYLIPRDTFATASPLQVEIGLDTREKSEIASGCTKLIRREWWFDLFKIGCRDAIVLEFTDLTYCGTGPALTACP